ncbi:MAG: excinuclease ABC subunit UvrC [Alphaproteobacteria bacterium]|nr:excinuclease ABC subunit UvrC [Alphaproteobacteria bacterium]
MNIQFRDLIKLAPNKPGIYKMYDSQDNLLYVGKAKNLSNRLKQYIDISKLENHKQVMRTLVTKVEWEITEDEKSALILEEHLIKTLKPKYNVMLTDGKMYPMLALTKHEYPRLLKFRGKISQKKDVFGPYPSVSLLTDTIKTIQQVCQLRTCTDITMRNRSKPCLLYQIGRCSAPCVIKRNNYTKNVETARKILLGYNDKVIEDLTNQMKLFSQKQEFEQAAKIRDKIIALNKTTKSVSKESVSTTRWQNNFQDLEKWLGKQINYVGVFDNSHLFSTNPVGAMIVFNKNGFVKSAYKHFILKEKSRAGNDIAMMQEFIARANNHTPVLDLIIVDGGKAQWNIATKTAPTIPVLGVAKGIVRNGDEHFIMPDGTENFTLSKTSNLFLFLRNVRDEAHRFVISYHRLKRNKSEFHSCLDDIDGVGPKTKKLLLQYFGSVKKIMEADLQTLFRVPNLSISVAKKIYNYFHDKMV